MTTSTGGSYTGLAALNSSYFTQQLRNRYDLPNPPPPEPKAQPMATAASSESALSVDITA